MENKTEQVLKQAFMTADKTKVLAFIVRDEIDQFDRALNSSDRYKINRSYYKLVGIKTVLQLTDFDNRDELVEKIKICIDRIL